jgi:hypothetical protein
MDTKEVDKQRIRVELELAEARLAECKAWPKNLTAEDRIKKDRCIEQLEQRIIATRERWQELDEADEAVWHQMKDSMMETWRALQDEIEEAIVDVHR